MFRHKEISNGSAEVNSACPIKCDTPYRNAVGTRLGITVYLLKTLRDQQVIRANLWYPLQWRIYIVKFWTPSKFFQFHAVFGKFWQYRMLAPPPHHELAPPPRGNPRSATAVGPVGPFLPQEFTTGKIRVIYCLKYINARVTHRHFWKKAGRFPFQDQYYCYIV